MKHADLITIGYCGGCEWAHVQLRDHKGRVFAQACVDAQIAKTLVDELQHYIDHGVRDKNYANLKVEEFLRAN